MVQTDQYKYTDDPFSAQSSWNDQQIFNFIQVLIY